MNTLPTEIQDQIFLNLKPKDLMSTRELQSMYVQEQTQLSNILIAVNNGDLKAVKDLYDMGYDLDFKDFHTLVSDRKSCIKRVLFKIEAIILVRKLKCQTIQIAIDLKHQKEYEEYQDLINKVRLQFEV